MASKSTLKVVSTKLTPTELAAMRLEAKLRGLTPYNAISLAIRAWVALSRRQRFAAPACPKCGGSPDVGHDPTCYDFVPDAPCPPSS